MRARVRARATCCGEQTPGQGSDQVLPHRVPTGTLSRDENAVAIPTETAKGERRTSMRDRMRERRARVRARVRERRGLG